MASTDRKISFFGGIGQALSHPQYFRFWASNALSTIGRWLHRMAVAWLAWELTKSTVWLGIVAFADIFPMVVFSVIGGAVADRIGYLRCMRVTQLGTCLVAGVFAFLTLSGAITIELVTGLAFLYGTLDAISTPVRMSAVNAMVPPRDLPAAIALGSATFNGARLFGPAIAGALLPWIGVGNVMAIETATFVQFWLILQTIRFEEAGRDRKLSFDLFGDIAAAVRYAAFHPGIRFLLLMLGITGLLIRPFMELIPAFADEVFRVGAAGMGMLVSPIGFGGLISGLWLAQRGRMRGLTRHVTTSLALSAVALLLFTVTRDVRFAMVFLFGVGYWMLVGGISSQTLIQNAVEPAMRARVLSLFVLISWGVPALGALAAGKIADLFGLQLTVGLGAAAVVLLWPLAHMTGRRLAPGLERDR